MKLHTIGILIIQIQLFSVVIIDIILKKVAQHSKSNHLPGGNNLHCYMLGLSNDSGMFDFQGTMRQVPLQLFYGFKNVWIPWL